MDYLQVRDAVWDAFWRNEAEHGNALLDEYIASQQGEELGRAYTLKAAAIASFCPKRTAEGLVLVDEALVLVRHNPYATAVALKIGLALCYSAGDPQRAEPYEESACRFLLEYGGHPQVCSQRHGIQLNLGLIASIRGDYATAYWYLVQASSSLAVPEVSEKDRHFWEFQIQIQIALACLRVRRFFEAQEALDLAEACSSGHLQQLRLPIIRAELLRQLGQTEEAKQLLDPLAAAVDQSKNTDIAAWYYWVLGLIAEDLGEMNGSHRSLAKAQELAAENHHDYLLGEIQRFRRKPNVIWKKEDTR